MVAAAGAEPARSFRRSISANGLERLAVQRDRPAALEGDHEGPVTAAALVQCQASSGSEP
ncbi:MAG: hypothetical protein IPK75_19020 [Acidobacteria bacterium]|nr:hypothetical protein [Acidobacteriota bacterium]